MFVFAVINDPKYPNKLTQKIMMKLLSVRIRTSRNIMVNMHLMQYAQHV
ncbi:hypothetical protein [Escherichia coli]|nr:hypothetical protein [Escherichia coli]